MLWGTDCWSSIAAFIALCPPQRLQLGVTSTLKPKLPAETGPLLDPLAKAALGAEWLVASAAHTIARDVCSAWLQARDFARVVNRPCSCPRSGTHAAQRSPRCFPRSPWFVVEESMLLKEAYFWRKCDLVIISTAFKRHTLHFDILYFPSLLYNQRIFCL